MCVRTLSDPCTQACVLAPGGMTRARHSSGATPRIASRRCLSSSSRLSIKVRVCERVGVRVWERARESVAPAVVGWLAALAMLVGAGVSLHRDLAS